MQRVLLLSILSFFAGIAWRSVSEVDAYTVAALLVGALAVSVLGAVRGFHEALLPVVLLCALSLGVVRAEFAYRHFAEGLVFGDGTTITLEGSIIREPDMRDEHTNLTVRTEHQSGFNAVFIVRVPHLPAYVYGDRVRISGTVRKPEAFETDTGRLFEYGGYLMKDGVQYELSRAEVISLGGNDGNVIIRTLLSAKNSWLEAVARTVPEPSASLLGGIVVGAKRSLGEDWLAAFRDTGIIHIVVLSGYNLTLVALFIVWLTKPLSRTMRLTLGVAGIIGFALMTGAGATVVRASVMAVLALLAQFLARPYAILRALVFAAFLMVLANPFLLVFDPGFQLSFVATLGLVLGAPLLERYVQFVPEAFGLRTILAATLATQVAVLPILLYSMGKVSLVAPLVNLLVLPVVPFVMAVGFMGGLLGMLATTLAMPFAYLVHGMLAYIFTVVQMFAALPFASVVVPPLPVWGVFVLYVVFGMMFFLPRHNIKPPAERRAV